MTVAAPPIHFISGLPRSGSTLLAALLRQNPRFSARMSSPVGGLLNRLLDGMSNDEGAVFISATQKRAILLHVVEAYYQEQINQSQIIFDTNRLWCSKLSLIAELFPNAKVICCVRNVAWVMDSFERLVRRNALDVSGLFNTVQETATVYSRTEALAQSNRVVGFAYNALREAYYGDQAHRLLVVEYDLLAKQPQDVMALMYQFLGEPSFAHNFDTVDYDEPEFDAKIRSPGLHRIQGTVRYTPRQTILPPDLFEKYAGLSFWQDATESRANVICSHSPAGTEPMPADSS